MADPKREVVSVSSDGGFQMAMMELATSNQEGLELKHVVMNNESLGMVREAQRFSFGGHYTMVDLKGGPDYEQLAKAYRMKYLKIETNADVETVVPKFLKTKGSVLLEVIVDEDGIVRKGGAVK